MNWTFAPSTLPYLLLSDDNAEYYGKQLDAAAERYENEMLLPFFSRMVDYVGKGYAAFDCPGTRADSSTAATLPASLSTGLAKRSSAQIYIMLTPVYLETARNPFGFIGGIDSHCFEEKYLRKLVEEVASERKSRKSSLVKRALRILLPLSAHCTVFTPCTLPVMKR
ncbi:Orn/Lys/Arg decarboxylase-like protein [Klebsiella oxytoca]|uniref:Orn/Lys/Arg decarboxylase-like protein n=1 Tax=Klebsiella oxytoca TaxID=571 RepID=A0A318FUE1_KLEOX|nr:Orn/Lys/Arg decarboxylase-like protein [Klebsiella oxytoca]